MVLNMLAIPFPVFDPVAVSLGPLDIRWYALAYIAGLVLGWRYMVFLVERRDVLPQNFKMTKEQVDDFLFWATLGVLLGGRLGYVLFYDLPYFVENPADIFKLWQGGMAFHGGFLGVVLAGLWFAKKQGISALSLGDLLAAAAPLGLMFGRIANFINGELFGRPTTVPWAMVFPNGGPLPRHPSQLYQAFLEGFVLFVVLAIAIFFLKGLKRPGLVMGLFLIGYGSFRFLVEFVRQFDPQVGLFFGGISMGQLLSVPMVLVGGYFIFRVTRGRP